jgi:membrane-associated HD superfamily phosphohydrolase
VNNMWDLLKDTDGFVAPLLLLIIGWLFRLAQTQMQDRRKAREDAIKEREAREAREIKEREAREARDIETKRDAQRVADLAREAAERSAREDRDRLERELEREREDRRREADQRKDQTDQMFHHLKNKLQTAENMQGIHDKQTKLLEEQKGLLQDRLNACEVTIERLKRRLRKHEPVGDDE